METEETTTPAEEPAEDMGIATEESDEETSEKEPSDETTEDKSSDEEAE